ncbi:hypothetical protein [Streptomyces phaeochromogenes]
MDVNDALGYAERLAAARHGDDPEMRETVLARVAKAAGEEATVRLLRSPLQVAIMSLLMERRARIPQHRYELFTAYYDTIYAREVDKPTSTGQLLADHRFHIDWLHQHVGLLLQTRAAQDEQLDALVEEDELRERTQKRLLKETEDPGHAEALGRRLIDAATDRLVLLVAPEAGYVGFEVRSLQEYMAARALISGPEADIIARLESLAPSSSWRNAWLLAAAGIFPTKPHLRDDLQPAHLSLGTTGVVRLWRLTPDGRTSSGATAATLDTAARQGIPAELSTPDAPSSKVVIRMSKQRATPLASAQAARGPGTAPRRRPQDRSEANVPYPSGAPGRDLPPRRSAAPRSLG